jgi:hypothetical protein
MMQCLSSAPPPGIQSGIRHEGAQRHDLECQARDHDVDSHLPRVLCTLVLPVGDGRDGAANGLQDQTDEVAGHEDDRQDLGPDIGDALVAGIGNAREGDVKGGGEEGRCDGQADEISAIMPKVSAGCSLAYSKTNPFNGPTLTHSTK